MMMMGRVAVVLPEVAEGKLQGFVVARDMALDSARAASSRLSALPADADQRMRERLASERDRHNEQHRRLSLVVSKCNQWLMESRGVTLQTAQPVNVTLKDGETVSSAIAAAREKIAAVQRELVAVRSAPLRKQSQQEAISAYLARLAQQARPKIGFDVRGNASVLWAEEMIAGKDDLLGLLCFALGPQQLSAAFFRQLEQEPERADALSPVECDKRIAEATQRLFEAEWIEESLILRAHADGIDVQRRSDADVRCLLGVTAVAATKTKEVA